MARTSDQTKLKLLLLLGGTISATAGAFSVLGVPSPVPAPAPVPVPERAPLRPAAPTRSAMPAPERAGGRHREKPAPAAVAPDRVAGLLVGPRGRLGATPVELVPLPRPGQPRPGSIKVLTDDRGRFRFDRPPRAEEEWALFIQAPGYGLAALALPAAGRPLPPEIRLTYSRWVKGRVLDAQGRGLAGARVKVGIPLEEEEGSRVLWLDRERSGREGAFTLRHLPVERRLFVMADHPRHNPSRPEALLLPRGGSLPVLHFQLLPGRRVQGRVRRRSGAAGAGIRLIRERILYGGARVVRQGLSDEEGRFELAGLSGGSRNLVLWTVSPRGRRHRLQAVRHGKGVVVKVPW